MGDDGEEEEGKCFRLAFAIFFRSPTTILLPVLAGRYSQMRVGRGEEGWGGVVVGMRGLLG